LFSPPFSCEKPTVFPHCFALFPNLKLLRSSIDPPQKCFLPLSFFFMSFIWNIKDFGIKGDYFIRFFHRCTVLGLTFNSFAICRIGKFFSRSSIPRFMTTSLVCKPNNVVFFRSTHVFPHTLHSKRFSHLLCNLTLFCSPLLYIAQFLLGQDYSKQELARDIYLLDRSGVVTTRKGAKVSLPASTGTKSIARTLSVINERGEEKLYFGISFSSEEQP